MSYPDGTVADAVASSESTAAGGGGGGDGIVVRDLASLEDYQQALALQEEVWGPAFEERVPAAILMIAQKIGGVSAGAFDAGNRMLGFVFGLSGFRDGRAVHWSDMLAVRAEARGQQLGERLKRFQRERVRAVGCRAMLWTYDPLMARNAHFNLQRLGARVVEYAENLYGVTGSALHGGMPTDRFVVEWELDGAAAPEAAAFAAWRDAPLLVASDATGAPVTSARVDAPRVRVAIPDDLERLQAADRALALRWRLATREAFTTALALGYTVRGFQRAAGTVPPAYLLARDDVPEPAP